MRYINRLFLLTYLLTYLRGPHNFRGAPVAQPATNKFGTKIVTATYYRSEQLALPYKPLYKPMSSALSRKI